MDSSTMRLMKICHFRGDDMNAICLIYGLSAGVIISSIIFIINLYCRWKQSEREKAVIEITSYIKGYGDGIMEAKKEFVAELDEMENKVKTFMKVRASK